MHSIPRSRHIAPFILALTFLIAPFAQAEVIQLDNDGLKKLLAEGVTLVDIRRPDEWQRTGIVEGSRLLTFFHDRAFKVYDIDAWVADFEKIIASKDQPVILICHSGSRTTSVTGLVDQLGYKTVYNVTEGIVNWMKAGNPTVAYEEK